MDRALFSLNGGSLEITLTVTLTQNNYPFQMDPDPLNNEFRFMKYLFLIKNFFPLIFKNNESYRILNTDSWECKISNN